MNKRIIQFGFKHVSPTSMNWGPVLDCRTIKNPFYPGISDEEGKAKARLDPKFEGLVQEGVQLIAEHETLYVGCYGGKHRSGAVAEEIGKRTGAIVDHWNG